MHGVSNFFMHLKVIIRFCPCHSLQAKKKKPTIFYSAQNNFLCFIQCKPSLYLKYQGKRARYQTPFIPQSGKTTQFSQWPRGASLLFLNYTCLLTEKCSQPLFGVISLRVVNLPIIKGLEQNYSSDTAELYELFEE